MLSVKQTQKTMPETPASTIAQPALPTTELEAKPIPPNQVALEAAIMNHPDIVELTEPGVSEALGKLTHEFGIQGEFF